MQKWWNGRHAVFRRQCEQSRESSNLFFCTNCLKSPYLRAFLFVNILLVTLLVTVSHKKTNSH